ncbi:MAG: endopeptidase La [Actinomycetota bacterium]|nr:endopeptidase La [Actinomycetota bacterium]
MIEITQDSGHQEVEVGGQRETPARLPVLPMGETVPLPDTLMPLAVGQERSVRLVNDVLAGNRLLVMVASREGDGEAPGPEQLYDVGVVGSVARMLKIPDGTLRILVQSAQRVRLDSWEQEEPYLVATLTDVPDVVQESSELVALQRNVLRTFGEIAEKVHLPDELQIAVANVEEPSALAYLVAGSLGLKTEEKQELLEEPDVAARLRKLVEALARELEVAAIGSEIQSQVQSELDKGQREYVLRQQLKAIKKELGDFDESAEEAGELREQLHAMELPADVRKQADRELDRLENLPPATAEHGVIRTYLEWIASLPWDRSTEDRLDLAHAREVLDEDHYDIAQVKERILEFLAVRKLMEGRDSHFPSGSILCFVGPPGVGKTSLGRSIAKALGREFERISAGGVRDESEIRGHRRTYIGAMPGTIIRALRDAGSNNPLFMIDEIDKMGADYRGGVGGPESAMLEVLDPEQNGAFRDHYLDVPFDLSNVMFITTANALDMVPGPLRDRMEVIPLAGYTADDKLQIAKRYLVPRQVERNGLKKSWISISDAALKAVIADYTREAGVRGLEREIGTLCRKVAFEIAGGDGARPRRASLGEARARELLGRQKFFAETRRRTQQPGVATGLAWTPVGGDVLFVEATAMPTRSAQGPEMVITGQLGDVMTESALAALSYVRGHVAALAPALGPGWFAEHDLHLHVPAGAIPKDGPSAGVTMITALVSLLTGRCVREEVAMTGEITLTGQVLPIGGLKEKALAAQRHGISTLVAPARNEGDVDEIPAVLRSKLEFHWVAQIGEVLEVALEEA